MLLAVSAPLSSRPDRPPDETSVQLEAIGSEEKYESPQLGIIAHAQAKNTDFDGAQFVVYNGRKGLGVQGGSGHPLIHGTDEAWQAQINGGVFSPVANQAAAARKAIEARKNRECRADAPTLLSFDGFLGRCHAFSRQHLPSYFSSPSLSPSLSPSISLPFASVVRSRHLVHRED